MRNPDELAVEVRVETSKLMADAAALDDHAVYLPGAVCRGADWGLFAALYEELAPWKPSPCAECFGGRSMS